MEKDQMDVVMRLALLGVIAGIFVAVAGYRTPPRPQAGLAGAEPGHQDSAPTVEALVVPYGEPRHAWAGGGTVKSVHSPSTMQRVIRQFAQDGRPVPLVEEADGEVRGWVVALKPGPEGLMAKIAAAPGAHLKGRFLSPTLEEEVVAGSPGLAVPRRLARLTLTAKPSLPLGE